MNEFSIQIIIFLVGMIEGIFFFWIKYVQSKICDLEKEVAEQKLHVADQVSGDIKLIYEKISNIESRVEEFMIRASGNS